MFTTRESGNPWIWLSGSAVAVCLLLVGGLFSIIVANGLASFWPSAVARLELDNGTVRMGQIVNRETIPAPEGAPAGKEEMRIQLRQGNRDVFGEDFVWVPEKSIVRRENPPDAFLVDRKEWGSFIGFLKDAFDGEKSIGVPDDSRLQQLVAEAAATQQQIRRIERDEIGEVSRELESKRIALKMLVERGLGDTAEAKDLQRQQAGLQERFHLLEMKISMLRADDKVRFIFTTVDNHEVAIPSASVVRVYQPNRLSVAGKLEIYAERIGEFLWADPRESNTEGGVFPAIFGTVMVVILMSAIVTPLGVLAAIYLREYAKQGRFVSFVRIAVNNLAGVPSIVFGVFGVGFFIYGLGGSIDRLFFSESLPAPTFGTGGILWASLTLALLTVPTVIVSTEEGLASIPRHLREASYALGATKFETTWKVVLPALTPSILTGIILATARAAGEVAPLMITGVVKLAPSLPVDTSFPFVHFDRKFMHLGFHIFDVGFQSPNVDAARPMVFATTLLLLVIVIALNLTALILRNRLRRLFATSAV